MIRPDPPADVPVELTPSLMDPAVVVQLTLTEAEYLKMQAAAMVAANPAEPSRLWDLSPLGR